MKWALIYLLGTSGIWDTGLRFTASDISAYERCRGVALDSVTAMAMHHQHLDQEKAYRMDVISGQWLCIPSKD